MREWSYLFSKVLAEATADTRGSSSDQSPRSIVLFLLRVRLGTVRPIPNRKTLPLDPAAHSGSAIGQVLHTRSIPAPLRLIFLRRKVNKAKPITPNTTVWRMEQTKSSILKRNDSILHSQCLKQKMGKEEKMAGKWVCAGQRLERFICLLGGCYVGE